jgi:hypothetical protein
MQILALILVIVIFFARPRCKCSHTRAHTHPYERTHAHPTSMRTSEELSWIGKSRDWSSHRRCLVVDGHVAYHWKNSAVKSWNKSRKIRTPVSSRGLESGWADSTTRNPTVYGNASARTFRQTPTLAPGSRVCIPRSARPHMATTPLPDPPRTLQ